MTSLLYAYWQAFQNIIIISFFYPCLVSALQISHSYHSHLLSYKSSPTLTSMTIRLKVRWCYILLVLAIISLLLPRASINGSFELSDICIDDAKCEPFSSSIHLTQTEFSSQGSFFNELNGSSKSHTIDSNKPESEQSPSSPKQSQQSSPKQSQQSSPKQSQQSSPKQSSPKQSQQSSQHLASKASSLIEGTDFSTTDPASMVKSESESGSKYESPYTIVTAISGNHLCALESFLHSLRNATEQLKPSQRPRIIVYSLGIVPKLIPVIDALLKAGFMDEFIELNWDKYPKFWHIQQPSSGQYAWKIGIINEVAKRWGGIIVWLDAGTRISLKAVKGFQGYVNVRGGLWSTVSFGKATDLTHKGMYDWFQDSPTRYLGEKNCNGAMFGFDAENPTIVNKILDPLTRCAWDHDCIGPDGANRTNHRHDQSALTYLMIKNGYRCASSPTAYGILSHNDRHCSRDLRNLRMEGKLLNPSFLDLKLKPGEIPDKTE